MVNIFAYRPTIVIARKDISFTDCGVSVANTLRIVKIGEPFLSYYPARDVNGITGFERDQAYFYFASQNIDLEGIADNQIPADLQITPGTNVFASRAFAGIALQTVDFASVGFDSSNLLYIYKVGDPYLSYAPLNDINALSGFEIGEAYYGYALADMDLSDYLIPPIVVSSDVEQPVEPYHYYGTEATTDKSYYKVPVRFFDNEASLPATGEENIIYVAKAENTSSYWDGATYQQIGGGTSYSDEQAQDAVGTILSSEFSYDDATPQISINQIPYSKLTGTPTIPSQYTDEMAQDAVGSILSDSDTIDFTYDDATPAILADVKKQMSIDADASGLKLSGDSAAPGNSKYYGTNGSGAKGFYTLPASSYTFTNGLTNTGGTVSLGSAAVVVTDANYTVAAGDYFITLPDVTANRTVTLPAASTNAGRKIVIWNQNSSASFNWSFAVPQPVSTSGATDVAISKDACTYLVCDGTNWLREDSWVKLSGTSKATDSMIVDLGATNTLQFSSSKSGSTAPVSITNSGGAGLSVNSAGSNTGVLVTASTGTGITVVTAATGGSFSGTSSGITVTSDSGTPILTTKNTSTTNSTVVIYNPRVNTTGTAAAGFGCEMDFDAEYVGGSSTTFGVMGYAWTDAAAATRTSKYFLKTMLNGSNSTTLEVEGDGHVNRFHPSGAATTTTDATPTQIKTISTTTNKVYEIEVTVKASLSTNTSVGVLKRLIRVKNSSGTVTILSTQTIGTDDVEAALSGISISASVSGSNILITATGLSATTLVWGCLYDKKEF